MSIHVACLFGQLVVVEYLITEQRCDPNSSGKYGRTPLHCACENGHMDIIKYLITEYDCDPALSKDKYGNMSIHLACLYGQLLVVEYLMTEQHCDPNSRGIYGRTPLHCACQNGHMDIIKYIITKLGCDPALPKDKNGNMSMHVACLFGQLVVVKYLITEQHCDPNSRGKYGRTPLHCACENGHMDIIKFLIRKHGCDPILPDDNGDISIHIACHLGQLVVVKYLITQQHCDPNSRGKYGRTPLHCACENGHIDIIKYLITKNGCDPALPKDKHSNISIHIACLSGQLLVVKYLITEQHCDPNSRGNYGRTPLHCACENGHVDIIQYLIIEHGCDPALPDDNGDMPIHIACIYGQLVVVQYLITERHCDPNSSGKYVWKPLHCACQNGHMDIIKYLITKHGCDPALPNNNGNMPIHVACLFGQLVVVEYLITERHCDPNSSGKYGWKPLHCACQNGHMDIIKYLITERGCDPALPNNNGNMPIHVACLFGQLVVVKYLITEQQCNPNSRGNYGRTPLHCTCENGHMDIIQSLFTEHGCDPALPDVNGDMPIHIACLFGQLVVVKYLITEQHCNPNSKGKYGRTPLHCASDQSHMNIIQYLISEQGCDPAIADNDGKTPLHYASGAGHIHVLKWLIQDRRIDVFNKDKNGRTAIDYAESSHNSYELLNLFKPFLQSIKSYPIHSFTKTIITGNSGAGKSSLAQCIIQQASRGWFQRFRKIPPVEQLTAGINTHFVYSPSVGNMILFDLAGHAEYNFSHSAIMEVVIRKSSAIFVNLVDLSKSEEEITHALCYWLNFIQESSCKSEEKSFLVIVGSHVDMITENQKESKKLLVTELAEARKKRLEYIGFVGMDCRKMNNKKFPSLVLQCHHSILDQAPSLSIYCHLLYAFLRTKVERIAIDLKDLISNLISVGESPIPLGVVYLNELLESLNEIGVIIYMKNKQCVEKSWVVIKMEILLKEVNGVLFAPKHFEEYHPIASNTGIIHLSSFRELFSKYDPEMLVELLVSLEFCLPVNLSSINTNLQATVATDDEIDRFLFFPSLLNTEQPQDLVIEQSDLVAFGWCLGSKDYQYQYFSVRFLHVLILRLAYTFPLPKETISESYSLHGLEQRCTVWTNGISWNNEDGIRTVVEVIQQNRWVVVTMYHNKDITRPVEYSKHRSAVIRLVLDLQKELAPDLETLECLISPSLLQQCPLESIPETANLYSIKDTARAVLLHKSVILSCTNDSHQLSTEKAVFFEPYYLLSSSSVCELMDSNKSDQTVSSALLNEVRECCQLPHDQLESQSHLSLRQHLDSMSIFTGRNPLVSGLLWLYEYFLLYSFLQVVAELDPNEIVKQSLTYDVEGKINFMLLRQFDICAFMYSNTRSVLYSTCSYYSISIYSS